MTMDLFLWRHAESEDGHDGLDDLQRALTARGEKQAARIAKWLDLQLPENTRILCSPALRCEQTVLPLGREYTLCRELAPDAGAALLLDAALWPDARRTVLVAGHQPTLGQAIARLMGLKDENCPVRKGAIWWLRSRERNGQQQTVVIAVQSPDTL